MKRSRGATRIEAGVAADGLGRRQRLDLDPPLPQLLERLALGPESAFRARTQDQALRQLVDTYARSKFEDTRRKAQKFGARGTTTKAYKPAR